MALGVRGQLKKLADASLKRGYVSESIVKDAHNGRVFVMGTDLIASTASVRATVVNPAGSGTVLSIVRLITAHDQSGVLPAEIIRNPDTNTPTTAQTIMNMNVGNANTTTAESYADSGTAMTGAVGSMFLPTVGNIPLNLELRAPMVLHPGNSAGINLDVGSALTSGEVMVSLAWVETPSSELA